VAVFSYLIVLLGIEAAQRVCPDVQDCTSERPQDGPQGEAQGCAE
jgi:hypothetical protein